MTENNKGMQPASQEDELVLVLDGIYSELAQDINAAKTAIVNEVKYSAVQSQSVENALKAKIEEQIAALKSLANELKYSLQQNQAVHTDVSETIQQEVASKLEAVDGQSALLQEIDKAIHELEEKVADISVEAIADKVLAGLPTQDELDYDKIGETVAEKAEAVASEHTKQVIDAVAAIPVAENIDYTRIVEEVGDRVLEIVQEHHSVAAAPAVVVESKPAEPVEIDYERIVYETAEKVIECLPPVEKIDYAKLCDMVAAKVVVPQIDYEKLCDMVAAKVVIPQIDYEKLCDMVAAKIVLPQLDCELLADKVAEKLAAKETVSEVFIDADGVQDIADTVANKLAEAIKVEATVDCDMVADAVMDRLSKQTFTLEEIVEEAPMEEIVEEAPAEEIVEEAVAEAVVEEAPVEEPAEVEMAVAEVVVAEEAPAAPVIGLVEADGDMVVRLKRSFVAKLKLSEDDIKTYYGILKNALLEYKKINSNISWHGDRFNFGRDTVARITIIGKTLGLYLALDPADPEFKQTVYRQKDVSKQKAYEGTPFMVKIKSDGGLKKALRLVAALAEKLSTEKVEAFAAVDYVAMYPVATDEEMLAEGLIKATKEKKVELDF